MTVSISIVLAQAIIHHHQLAWWGSSRCWAGKAGELTIAVTVKEGYALLEYI